MRFMDTKTAYLEEKLQNKATFYEEVEEFETIFRYNQGLDEDGSSSANFCKSPDDHEPKLYEEVAANAEDDQSEIDFLGTLKVWRVNCPRFLLWRLLYHVVMEDRSIYFIFGLGRRVLWNMRFLLQVYSTKGEPVLLHILDHSKTNCIKFLLNFPRIARFAFVFLSNQLRFPSSSRKKG